MLCFLFTIPVHWIHKDQCFCFWIIRDNRNCCIQRFGWLIAVGLFIVLGRVGSKFIAFSYPLWRNLGPWRSSRASFFGIPIVIWTLQTWFWCSSDYQLKAFFYGLPSESIAWSLLGSSSHTEWCCSCCSYSLNQWDYSSCKTHSRQS